MSAFSTGVQGTAYNVANINTNGFNPVSVHYQSGPVDSKGLEQGVNPIVSRGQDSATFSPEALEAAGLSGMTLNNVDIAKEMTSLISDQRGFEANAKPIITQDEMLGTAINLIA